MSHIMLRCQHIIKTFAGITALKRISMDVHHGEVVGLIGAKGSGKTTLINIISGQYHADSGSIRFDGQDITGCSPNALTQIGIARTFQRPRLFASLTVVDNIALARITKHPHLSRKDAIDLSYETLEFIGLRHKARLPVARLSLYERKSLTIGRALALNPKLMLLDEIFTHLKPDEVTASIDLIRRIHHTGVTLLLVEHHMEAVRQLCERLIVLNAGEKIADGLPDEVLNDEHIIPS